MSDNKNYIGESQMKDTPQKKLKIRISDGAVTTDKLANRSVTIDKLGDDVTAAIEDIEHYGVVVSQELGDSPVIGISQQKLTQEIEGIHSNIERLNGKQDALEFDTTPTEGSINPATSGGIKDALDMKANASDVYNKTQIDNMIVPHDSALVLTADHTAITLPETNTIYREYGESSYADWMYNGATWVKLAEYDNAIDDTPTKDSENLVKSGGVFIATRAIESNLTELKNKLSDDLTGVASVLGNGVTLDGDYDIELVDGEYKVKTKSGSSYKVIYLPVKAVKGTTLKFSGYTNVLRRQTMCYLTTDPASIATWNNTVCNLINTSSINGNWDIEYTIPEDGWFIYYFYNQDWTSRRFNVYKEAPSISSKTDIYNLDYSGYGTWQSGGINAERQGYCSVTTNEDGQPVITINSTEIGGWFGITTTTLPLGKYTIEIEYTHTDGDNWITSNNFYKSNSSNDSRTSPYNYSISTSYSDGRFKTTFVHYRSDTFYLAFFGQYFTQGEVITITSCKITRVIDDYSEYLIEEHYIPFLESGKCICADESDERFGEPMELVNTIPAVSNFFPLKNASKIRLYTLLSAPEGDERVGKVGIVAYNSDKEPIAVVHKVEEKGGASAYGYITWNVISGATYIRTFVYGGAAYADFMAQATLFYSLDKIIKSIENDSFVVSYKRQVIPLNNTAKYGCIANLESTLGNYGAWYQSSFNGIGASRNVIMSVAGAEYITFNARWISTGGNANVADLGGVVLDSYGNVLDTIYRIIPFEPGSGTYSRRILYKLPEGADTIRITNTTSASTLYLYMYASNATLRSSVTGNVNITDKQIYEAGKKRKSLEAIKQGMFNYSSDVTLNSRLGLLHYSDWHESVVAGGLLMDWVTAIQGYFVEMGGSIGGSYVTDVINTGDVVENYLSGGSPSAYFNVQGLANKSLFVLGNHDQAYSSNGTIRYGYFWADCGENGDGNIDMTAEKSEVVASSHKFSYNRYFQNYHAGWGVTMPTGWNNPASPYYQACYWHKDYTAQKIRLIGLDCIYRFDGILKKDINGDFVVNSQTGMLDIASGGDGYAKLTTEQETWLKGLLDEVLDEESSVYGYSVICLAHYPLDDLPARSVLDEAGKNSTYGKVVNYQTTDVVNFENTMGDSTAVLNAAFNMDNRVQDSSTYGFHRGDVNNMGDILKKFQDNGGEIIAWICGHTHTDHFYYPEKYPDILNVVIDRAGENRSNAISNRNTASDTCLCANFYAVDTNSKYFKIIRLGMTKDRRLRSKETLCYDYGNKKVLSEG